MCLPAVAIGLTVGSSLLQAGGQIAAGNANNRIAQANARNLDLSAEDAVARGDADAQVQRQQFAQVMGAQRAGLSAANVDISRGSAADLITDTAGVGELEVMRTINNATREAYGLRSQAVLQRAEGKMAKRMGYLGAGATLLAGAGDTFGMTRGMKAGRVPQGSMKGMRVGTSTRGMVA